MADPQVQEDLLDILMRSHLHATMIMIMIMIIIIIIIIIIISKDHRLAVY